MQIPSGVLYLIALGSTWHSDESLLELLSRTKKDRGILACMHHVCTFSHTACVFSLTAGRHTIFLLFVCICMFVCLSGRVVGVHVRVRASPCCFSFNVGIFAERHA